MSSRTKLDPITPPYPKIVKSTKFTKHTTHDIQRYLYERFFNFVFFVGKKYLVKINHNYH